MTDESRPPIDELRLVSEIRSVWQDEAKDFTPWLVQPENLRKLSEAVGMELVDAVAHQKVGDFEYDIKCNVAESDDAVLIENQFGRSDHEHLGKMLVYAAGIPANRVIWIAERIRDEHRAVLQRQNEHSPSEVAYFGIEIKLFQIGDSSPAPYFDVVVKPNEWTRASSQRATHELSETERQRSEFWASFMTRLEEAKVSVNPIAPTHKPLKTWGLGRFKVVLNAHVLSDRIIVEVKITTDEADDHFEQLVTRKDEIEDEAGESLEWNENPSAQSSNIRVVREGFNLANVDAWASHQDWMVQRLDVLHRVFRPYVKQLN